MATQLMLHVTRARLNPLGQCCCIASAPWDDAISRSSTSRGALGARNDERRPKTVKDTEHWSMLRILNEYGANHPIPLSQNTSRDSLKYPWVAISRRQRRFKSGRGFLSVQSPMLGGSLLCAGGAGGAAD